jgi:hypothetical protein
MEPRKLRVVRTLGLVLAGLVTGAAHAAEIRTTYAFDVGAESCDAVACRPWGAGLASFGAALRPVLPVKVAHVLLPAGERFVRATFVPGPARELTYEPRIAGQARPISAPYALLQTVEPYAGGAYPGAWTDKPVVSHLRGYTVVDVRIFPLRMLGGDRAEYITDGELIVETAPAEGLQAPTRALARDFLLAAHGADNVAPAPLRAAREAGEGYLIIGQASLVGTEASTPFAPLIADKRARGLNVEIATLESVSPTKSPAQIRDFIRERYTNGGVDYVLIVGDKARFPWKTIRSGYQYNNSDPIPSDQYYACLDGDFSQPASYDWSCEVAVGRIAVSSTAQIDAWVEKTLALQAAAAEGRTHGTVMFGEKMDGSTLASWVLDWIATGTSEAPVTVGFPEATAYTRLNDTLSRSVTTSEVVSALNNNDIHVLNHLGHANSTYDLKLQASQLTSLRSRPAFWYTQGCYPNNPDVDSWTAQAVRMPHYGPAAVIANTRYGWYEPGHQGEGPSNMLHRTFWSTRFGGTARTIGRMNHDAKAIVVTVDTGSLMKYVALESSLMGDPELDLGIE